MVEFLFCNQETLEVLMLPSKVQHSGTLFLGPPPSFTPTHLLKRFGTFLTVSGFLFRNFNSWSLLFLYTMDFTRALSSSENGSGPKRYWWPVTLFKRDSWAPIDICAPSTCYRTGSTWRCSTCFAPTVMHPEDTFDTVFPRNYTKCSCSWPSYSLCVPLSWPAFVKLVGLETGLCEVPSIPIQGCEAPKPPEAVSETARQARARGRATSRRS